ncbi:hypothetical protein QOT17_013104 [Balamuthia mandrillaris]
MRTLCFFYILLCFFFFVLYGGLVVIVDAAFTFQSISPTNPTPGTQAELVYEVVDQAVRPSLGLIWLNVTANGNTLSSMFFELFMMYFLLFPYSGSYSCFFLPFFFYLLFFSSASPQRI